MLRGSREAILKKIQPVSIHGQISLDVHYVDPDDENGQVRVARIGPESVVPSLEPGDRIRLEFVLGAVTNVARVRTPSGA